MNTYLTPFEYIRASSGLETVSLVGNLGYINACVAGQTTLALPAGLTVAISQYDQISLFDGTSSEQRTVQASAVIGATSLTVDALEYNHANGTPYCTDGFGGSLADKLVQASADVERICQQSLLLQTYNDTIPLRTMQAVVSATRKLIIRPKNYPVRSVTSLGIEVIAGYTLTLDQTQAIIDSSMQVITVPLLQQIGASQSQIPYNYPQISRNTEGDILLGYTSGWAFQSLPRDVKEAAVLLASEGIAQKQNPTGAAESDFGHFRTSAFLRGDLTGIGALTKRAERILQKGNYVRTAW